MSPSYSPSVRVQFIGGIQWAVTAFYLFSIAFGLFVFVLETFQLEYDVSFGGGALATLLSCAFLGGFLWVRRRTPSADAERRAHRRRVEYLLVLLVVGLVFPFGVYGLFSVLSLSIFDLPFGAIALLMYVPPLLFSALAVYVLDLSPFLGE